MSRSATRQDATRETYPFVAEPGDADVLRGVTDTLRAYADDFNAIADWIEARALEGEAGRGVEAEASGLHEGVHGILSEEETREAMTKQQRWREKNPEKVKAMNREASRRYRARKKAEQDG